MATLKLVFRGRGFEGDDRIRCSEIIYNGQSVTRKLTRAASFVAGWVRCVIAFKAGWGEVLMRADSWPAKQLVHTPKKNKPLPKPLRPLFQRMQLFRHRMLFHESYVCLNNAIVNAQDINVELNGKPAEGDELQDIDRALVPAWPRFLRQYHRLSESDIAPAVTGFPRVDKELPILRVHFRRVSSGKKRDKTSLVVSELEYRFDDFTGDFNVFADTELRTTRPRHRLTDYVGMVVKMKRDLMMKDDRPDQLYSVESGMPADLRSSVTHARPEWLEAYFGDSNTQPIQDDPKLPYMRLHPALKPENIDVWYQGRPANSSDETEILKGLGIADKSSIIYVKSRRGTLRDATIDQIKAGVSEYILHDIERRPDASDTVKLVEKLLSILTRLTPKDEKFNEVAEVARRSIANSKTRTLDDGAVARAINIAAAKLQALLDPRLTEPRDANDMAEFVIGWLRAVRSGSITYIIELSSGVLSDEELDVIAEAMGYERMPDWDERSQLGKPIEVFPHQPDDDEVRRFLSTQYAPREPNTLRAFLREAIALLSEVIRMPRRGLKVSRMRYYFAPTLLAAGPLAHHSLSSEPIARRLVKPALVNAFLVWPAITFLAALVLTTLIGGRADFGTDVAIAAASTMMGWIGSVICGPLFNVLGVGTGTIFIALCFACVQAVLIRWAGDIHLLAHAAREADPFVAVVMGTIGASASVVRFGWQKVLLLAAPAVAITATAARMSEPRSDEPEVPRSDLEILAGAFFGTLAGGAIGMIMGLVSSLAASIPDGATRFCLVAVPVIAFVYGLAVWLRLEILPWKTRLARAALLAIACAGAGGVLWSTTIHWLGTPKGILIGDAGTSLLHASVFTLSYVIGYRIGGRRAGAIAAAVEGVGGFVIANSIYLGPANIIWVLLAAAGAIWELLVAWLAVCVTQIPSARILNPPNPGQQEVEFAVKSPSIGAVQRAANLLPPISFVSAVAILYGFHAFETGKLIAARAIHYVGIGSLLLFLLLSLYFQLESWSKLRRKESLQSLARTYWKWYVITKLLPAPAAISILVGGLGLIYASPTNGTFNSGWLLWLIIGFTFFFVDGLSFYLPEICYRFAAIRVALLKRYTPEAYSLRYCSRRNDVMLLIHAMSFPFVFALGAYKPQYLWRPVGLIEWLYHWFSNYGFTMTLLGGPIMLIVIVGVVILAIRGVPLYRRILSLRQLRTERIELNQ